jgi:hypothetical protein
LRQRVGRIYNRLLEDGVAKEALADIGTAENPVAYAKAKIEGAVDWVCGIPMLKEVSDWKAA